MITYKAKKSVLYNELDNATNMQYFDYTKHKFLHNIDSLYYVIKLKNDWRYDGNALMFKSYLDKYQQLAFSSDDSLLVFDDKNFKTGEWIMNGIGASKIYRYDLQQVDKFAVFIASNTFNDQTPELIVQLRSQFLWLEGEKKAVLQSMAAVEELLFAFGLEIKEIKENRIDFAYHTNYIQDPTNYFKHQNINKMQQSRFSRGSIEFELRRQWDVETDYLTLGRKTSNNLFFRVYDKTKEVIEKGYKQFFIKIWYMEKLISYFDMCCIERAFLHPSNDNYHYLDIARLEFYLEHGTDENYKAEIRNLISDRQSKDYDAIVELADLLTPPVTKILNVELETKRKFYATMDDTMTLLSVNTFGVPPFANKLFRILDNKKLFHDYLTRNTDDGGGVIRFIDWRAKNRLGKPWKRKKDYPTSDFWKRLQSVSVDWVADDVKLIREYQKNLSADLLKKRIVNSVSTYGLYLKNDIDKDVYTDTLDFIATLNENDLEIANQYKQKKKLLLKSQLEEIDTLPAKVNEFNLLNKTTGEVILLDDDLGYETSGFHAFPDLDYNINNDVLKSDSDAFVIESINDIAKSLIHDYMIDIEKYNKMLTKNNLSVNQKILLHQKIEFLYEKINDLKK